MENTGTVPSKPTKIKSAHSNFRHGLTDYNDGANVSNYLGNDDYPDGLNIPDIEAGEVKKALDGKVAEGNQFIFEDLEDMANEEIAFREANHAEDKYKNDQSDSYRHELQ